MNFHLTLPEISRPTLSGEEDFQYLQQYNPHIDCENLRAHPERFEQLRGDYPLRRE